jgi:VCBS repeat-containing protein
MENDLFFETDTSDMLTGNDAHDGVQVAAATSNGEPYADAVAVPLDAAQVEIPQGENVVRVPVTPGEVVELPFPADSQFLAREDNGNLAIKVGDITVILQGYVEAAGTTPPVIEASNGQPIDIATILASTDPNIDIQTAAGPAAGPQGQGADNTGGILQQFGAGAGLGGFEGAGAQDGTDGLGGGAVDQTGTLFRQFGLLEANLAPTAQDDLTKTNEDTPISGQAVAVDPEGDALIYAAVGGLPPGVTFGADGKWAFDPTALTEYQELDDGDTKTISFQFNATDGANTSNTATVTIDVAGLNDAPVAPDYTLTTNEDTKVNGTVIGTDVDKNDTLTYALVGALPPGVTFDAATGNWAFDPTGIKDYQELNVGDSKQISFQYKASDGTTDSTGTVTIDVDGVNDNPVFLGGTIGNFPPRSEDAANTHVDLNWAVVDVDDAPGTFTIAVDKDTLPPGVTFNQALGRLNLDTAGHYDYLAAGETQTFVIKFTITDAHGGTVEQDYTLTMTGKADASPHAVDDTVLTNLDVNGTNGVAEITDWAFIANDKDASTENVPAFGYGGSGYGPGAFQTNDYIHIGDDSTLGFSISYKLLDGSLGTANVVNQAGGPLTGTTAHEIIVSGDSGDKIDGKGGQDVIFGQDGDDTVIFHNGDIVVGGSDSITQSNGFATDSAALRGDMLVVDHDVNFVNTNLTTTSGGSAGGIETISTLAADGGAGKQTVVLGAHEVNTLSDHTITGVFAEERAIKIDGDAVDQLYLSISKDPAAGGGWVDTGTDVNGYHVFAHETTAGNAATADAYVMVQAANVANVHLNQDPT